MRFFHWELEFPDAFTFERKGFDAVIGNPPWDVMKPNSREFFTNHDPLYRTWSKETAREKQVELCQSIPGLRGRWEEHNAHFKAAANWVKSVSEPFDLALARGKEGENLLKAWECERARRVGLSGPQHPFVDQGSGDLNSCKLFLEVAYRLLAPTGRLGFVVPSGLYSDSGARDLRSRFLDHSTWDWLIGFENRRKVFDIDGRFKFAVAIVDRRVSDAPLRACFMIHDLADWERPNPPVVPFDRGLIPLFSPRSKSLPELCTKRDLDVCQTIYTNSIRIGDKALGWEIDYSTGLHMTNDSRHFPTLEKWQSKGFAPDVFGRLVGPGGEIAVPLYEGRMIGQFDFCQKGWVSGKARAAVWRPLPFDCKTLEPQYLVPASTWSNWPGAKRTRVGFMDVTSATNARTFIACPLPDLPCGNKVPSLSLCTGDIDRPLLLAAFCNSLACDFATRTRLVGNTMNWFIVEELPIPKSADPAVCSRLALNAARLSFLHRLFAPEWLRLERFFPDLSARPWKHWWAVTEADRLRLRIEIDALCADAYGLTPDDFDWIVKECRRQSNELRNRQTASRLDPKGFWRINKELDPRERLTNLAASAFGALQAGRWSASLASMMSNDEFFSVIGIPEMTTGANPLIRKRRGCHEWRPEEFAADDPRNGWTWKDCRQDAVALFGCAESR